MTAAFIAVLTALLGGGTDYRWPLDLSPQLTSSFAEYRPGRFHAGIDLRTGGIGQPVHAAAAGYVSRVRCSPWGYGKAVYVQLGDGRTAVYAHLDDYSDVLRAYVRQAQHQKQSYTVDLYPKAGRFPVERGEVVAKSGQTGIGAPHLHYEIRDASQQPINPRLLGMTWPDTQCPVIRKVLVAPGGPNATINGDLVPVVLDARPGAGRVYETKPVRVQGHIGFGVDVSDPGSGGYKLGIHRARLLADGGEVFRVQHDTLSYENHRNGAVAYHPYFLGEGKFLLLWRWPGNVCSSYACSSNDGLFDVPDEAMVLRIEVADFFGIHSTVIVPLLPGDEEPGSPVVAPGAGSGSVDLECVGNYLVVTARFKAAEPEKPELLAEGGGDILALPFRRTGAGTFRAGFVPPVSGAYTLHVSHPRAEPWARDVAVFLRGDAGRTVSLGDVDVRVQPKSPYGSLFLRSYPLAQAPATPIKRLGAAYRVWPTDAPVDEELELSFPMPPEAERAGRVHIYRAQGAGWSRENTERRGGRLVISTRRLGTYMAMEDTVPPSITEVTPPNGYQAQTRRPHIRATVADKGSGIVHFEVTCDGAWLLTAYDPERGRIAWERDEDLPPGKHAVAIRLTDAAGNTTAAERQVVIP